MNGRSGREAGLTLVELLVAMALTSVVLAGLGLVFASTLRTTSKITVRSDTTFDAREAVDAMSRRVRVAYPAVAGAPAFKTATPQEMSFYASINGGATGISAAPSVNPAPTLVTYRLADVNHDGRATKCLQETLVTARGDGASFNFSPPAATRSTCLAYGEIRVGPGSPFRYFTDDQAGTDGGARQTTDPCLVTSVQLSMGVSQPSIGGVASTSASSRILLTNTKIGAAPCSEATP